jgi:hypothetical protein
MNVFQLISQGYSKIQKKFSLGALEAAASGSNLGFNSGQGVVDEGCDLKLNFLAFNN